MVKPLAAAHLEEGWGTAWPYVWHGQFSRAPMAIFTPTAKATARSHGPMISPGQVVRGIGVTAKMLYLGTMHGLIYAFTPPRQR